MLRAAGGFLALGALLGLFAWGQFYDISFADQLSSCNGEPKGSRFSCYRVKIGTRFGEDVSGFALFLKENEQEIRHALSQKDSDPGYAVFGTNCHTFYHAAGDFVATYGSGDLQTLLDLGPSHCTNGYTMGLYKRLALKNNFDRDLLKRFFEQSR